MENSLDKFFGAVQDVLEDFKKHMGYDDEEHYCPGGDIFLTEIADCYWSLSNMVTILEENIDPEVAIEWYWKEAEALAGGNVLDVTLPSLSNYRAIYKTSFRYKPKKPLAKKLNKKSKSV